MCAKQRNTLIVLVGPTAVGKTAMAIPIARALACEILSADSRQFYRELRIGTAKPNAMELAQVPHHFINSHSIQDSFTAGDYETAALQNLRIRFEKHAYALMVGGSGLFINAVLQGLDELPKPGTGVRENLNNILETQGLSPLQQRLKLIDPEYFKVADTQNPQRVIRALEVYDTSGIPYSEWRKNNTKPRDFNTLIIGLDMNREALYDRINRRVDEMMQQGLLGEVRTLINDQDNPVLKTVGYAELFDYLNGKYSLDFAVEKIKQNSRRYAKRQLTWFKKNPATTWFDAGTKPEILIDFIRAQSGD